MEESKLSTQVLIIGAGPAGCGTSFYLSKAGIPHIIIEKETFPRDKVCGDGISGKSAHVLRKADPSWLQEIFRDSSRFTPSNGIIFVAPNGKPLSIPFGQNLHPGELAAGFTATRLEFDNFLFSKIDTRYATVFQNTSGLRVERKGKAIAASFTREGRTYEAEAPVIIGADGDKGIVRKTFVQDNNSEKTQAVGLRAYYEGVAGMDERNYIELHFLPEVLPGYFWIFPLPNGRANVGVGMPSGVVRSKKINLREQMLKAIEKSPRIAHRFKNATLQGKIQGWGLPMGMEKRALSGDGFILTGDAASLIDPFTGEGIGNALYSGMLAAEAVSGLAEKGTFDAASLKEAYDNVLYRRLWGELRISSTLQRLCKYPWLFNMVVNKAHKSPSLEKTISCMFTDLDLRDQLRKPSFYAKILLNR